MSNLTTCALAPEPIGTGTLQHFAASDDNLPNVAASDWRAEAEARGRLAYEAAVAEPQTTAEQLELAWLWGKEGRDDTKAPPIRAAKGLR